MSLLQLTRVGLGETGVLPGSVKMVTTANLATITTAGYLNGVGNQLSTIDLSGNDVVECLYSYNEFTASGSYAAFTVSISTQGIITLTSAAGSFLPLNGGTLTGNLNLSGGAALNLPLNSPLSVYDVVTLRNQFLQAPLLLNPTFIGALSSNTVWIASTIGDSLIDPLGLVAGGYEPGFNFIVKNTSGGNVTFTPFAGDTVDGVAGAVTIPAGQAFQFMAAGLPTPTEWIVTANYNLITGAINSSQVQTSSFNNVVDTGVGANTYVAAYSPAIVSYVGYNGVIFTMNDINASNTGASTFNGLPIILPTGGALVGNEMLAGNSYAFQIQGGNAVLLNSSLATGAAPFVWNRVTSGVAFTAVAGNGYEIENTTQVTLPTLASSNQGDTITIYSLNNTSFTLKPPAADVIYFGADAAFTGISYDTNAFSTSNGQWLTVVCFKDGNNGWRVVGSSSPVNNWLLDGSVVTRSFITPGKTILGTATNDNAAAGYLGESFSSVVIDGAGTTMVSGTPTDMTSISLPAGDYDVWGSLMFATLGSVPTKIIGWVSSDSATLPDASLQTSSYISGAPSYVSVSIPAQRFSLAATTTIYISGTLVNTSGNGSGIGFIKARRIR